MGNILLYCCDPIHWDVESGESVACLLRSAARWSRPPLVDFPADATSPGANAPSSAVLLDGRAATLHKHCDNVVYFSVSKPSSTLRGSEGLRAAGFEFRRVRCGRCRSGAAAAVAAAAAFADGTVTTALRPGTNDGRNMQDTVQSTLDDEAMTAEVAEKDEGATADCPDCVTRLYHVSSNTLITESNLGHFVKDGRMFDAVAKLCQEVVQDELRERYGLEWMKACKGEDNYGSRMDGIHCRDNAGASEESDNNSNLIMALADQLDEIHGNEHKVVSGRDPSENTPVLNHGRSPMLMQHLASPVDSSRGTLLVAPGIGKSRAGVFSRFHLLTSGIEHSTALPTVSEARRRGMGIIILDPNCRRKDRFHETFRRSIDILLCERRKTLGEEQDAEREGGSSSPLYVLSHSAAGGSLVRCLLPPPSTADVDVYADADADANADATRRRRRLLLHRIRAVVFADSTHNIQWARDDPPLSQLLQSPRCLYVRSNGVRSMETDTEGTNLQRKGRGMTVETDKWWRHRFGTIRTIWAGTEASHGTMIWHARKQIWDHFDEQGLLGDRSPSNPEKTE